MPTSPRAVVSAALATAVALPLTAVVLAAPAFADDRPGQAYARGRLVPIPMQAPMQGYGSPYGQLPQQQEQQSSAATLAGLDTSTASDAEEAGLVTISTTIDYGQGEAAGTGIVVGSDGTVVTNHHVVEGATAIQVTVVATGQTYTADLIGASVRKDVAVLRLEGASGLTPASTDASQVTTGQAVTAVGDAGGDAGDLTAAAGTVTAVGQRITVSDEETGAAHRLRRLVEVSSDVIPGDSGGALRNAAGDVVGMTVAASSGTTSATVSGYVIPWTRVMKVEQAVLAGQTTGDITLGYPAFLGVTLDSRTDSSTIAGVVDDSPAAGAGLAAGDTVTAVGGTAVSTGTALRAALTSYAAGDPVTISWTDASGSSHTADVTLAQGPVA